jgi:hypothetical protein
MKLVYWMLSGSILSALILTILLEADVRIGIWLGMLGPLISAIASWIAMERQHARHPRGMTRLLIKAFAVKMVFFAIYITVLLGLKLVQPVSFVISFACYYLSLHIMEAIGLRRLQAAGHPVSQEFFETS